MTLKNAVPSRAILDLEAILGPADAATVGERSLRAYGGWRRNSRTGIRTRRG